MVTLKLKSVLTITFGVLLAIGGIIGFVKAQSYMSLLMGGGFGILLVACGIGIARNHLISRIISIILTIFLATFFGMKFYSTHAIFPPGVFALLSLLVFIALILPQKSRG